MANTWASYGLYLLRAANGANPYAQTAGRLAGSFAPMPYQGYSFPADSRGRAVLPTLETLERANTPEAKLAVAGQLADVVKIQADAATRTGLPNRVAAMTDQCRKVLDAVEAVIHGLRTKDGSVAPGDSDPALDTHRKAISRVLGTLHGTLTSISGLLPKAAKDVAAQTDKVIQRMDITAGGLACLAGLEWKSLPSITPAGSAFTSDPAKLLDVII